MQSVGIQALQKSHVKHTIVSVKKTYPLNILPKMTSSFTESHRNRPQQRFCLWIRTWGEQRPNVSLDTI